MKASNRDMDHGRFHIFDLFLNNVDLESYHLSPFSNGISEFNNAVAFGKLLNALEQFAYPNIQKIWLRIASIIHLSLIEIPDEELSDTWLGVLEMLGNGPLGHLQSFCNLSGASLEECIVAFFFKKMTIKGEQNVIYSPLSAPLVRGRIDSLCIEMYSSLFDGLIEHMNLHLVGCGDAAGGPFIGILDIFGFESLHENSLEQLCINYANERLFAAYFNQVHGAMEKLYLAEGIQWQQNFNFALETSIHLMDGKMGIFNAIEEQCRLSLSLISSKKDVDRLSTVISNILHAKGSCGPIFQLRHFCNSITYNCSAFVQKNRIALSEELSELLGRYFIRISSPSSSSSSSTLLATFQVPLYVFIHLLEEFPKLST